MAVMRAAASKAVFLVGYMGAGKTTVGRLLAKQLGWEFLDLDEQITTRNRRSVAEIFETAGEDGFRRVESEALREVLRDLTPDSGPKVIALGGGTLSAPSNLELVRGSDMVLVYLDAPVTELYRRCSQQDVVRPLQGTEAEFRARYEQRRNSYRAANITVNTIGKPLLGVVHEIIHSLSAIPTEAN